MTRDNMEAKIENVTANLAGASLQTPVPPVAANDPDGNAPALTIQDIPPRAPENEYYEIRAVPGKGYGCFAIKDLKRGTRILSESPILTVPKGDYLTADIEAALAKLSDEDNQIYWSLASAHGQDPEEWPSRIHDSVNSDEIARIQEQHEARIAESPSVLSVFQNNCMDTGGGAGIFPHAARFNHSCRPNASFYWNANIERQTIHIIHAIRKGEEITISYCDMTLEKPLRAWELKHYGFVCDCEICAGDQNEDEGSVEGKRTRIKQLDQTTSYLRGANIELGVRETEFVKQLVELAVLHLEIGDHSMRLATIHVDLALACEFAGDFEKGQDMAANALIIKRDCQGEDSLDFQKYRDIVKRVHRKFKAAHKPKKLEAEEGGEDENL